MLLNKDTVLNLGLGGTQKLRPPTWVQYSVTKEEGVSENL